jgi:hypothetical protein
MRWKGSSWARSFPDTRIIPKKIGYFIKPGRNRVVPVN